jgi:anti-sigma factor RsiW
VNEDEENVEELLPTYAFGELSDEDRTLVEAALAESPRLREELSRYERLFVLLAAAATEEIEAPANLQARIARQVAIRAYIRAAEELLAGLLGAYAKIIVRYLGLA